MVDGEAPSHERGRARSHRALFRHDPRRALDEPRRRQTLDSARAQSARDLRCRSRRALTSRRMKVLIPTPLRSYTRTGMVEANGATVGEVLADLDRRYPGVRFRMVDEQDRMRPHMRFFVNGEQTFDLNRT